MNCGTGICRENRRDVPRRLGELADYPKIVPAMGANRVRAKRFSNDDMIRAIEELLGGNPRLK